MPRPFDVVAFDGDDTLWHNERSYRDARERFRRLLATAGIDLDEAAVEASVNRIELANLEYFGYGVSSFALSLIETAVELTGGRISGRDLRELVDVARQMVREEIELFDGARETLEALSASYRLMIITKGDLLHQTSKIERSGLGPCFNAVEVVSHKTPGVYRAILQRHGIDPARFLMVGNSLRSDVLPVLEVGGWGVYVPAALGWSHEYADPPAASVRFFELVALTGLPALVGRLEQTLFRAARIPS